MTSDTNLGTASESSEISKSPRGRPKRGSATGNEHPTRHNLLNATIQLFEVLSPEDITIDEVLQASNVSKGSLYHHFKDLADLLDQAMLARFSMGVDEHIVLIESVLQTASSQREVLEGFRTVTDISQQPSLRDQRTFRMNLLLRADREPELATKLALEQRRLTDALEVQIQRMQVLGWVRSDFNARAAAVLIQAYSIGRRVDQIVEDSVLQGDWNTLIYQVIEQGLMGLSTNESSTALAATASSDESQSK
jgi:AcrR family transcriptional regulator